MAATNGGSTTLSLKNSTHRIEPLIMQVSTNEAKFLAHAVSMWADAVPVVAGVPLMFTDKSGTKVLLSSHEIYDLFDRIKLQIK